MIKLYTDEDIEGYYGGASYRFSNWFEIGTYYAVFYWNREKREDDVFNFQNDWALSTRFDINEHWIFKLETNY